MKKKRVLRNILVDLVCAGLALTVFALFHHVLPRPQQSLGIVIPNPYQAEPADSGASLSLPEGSMLTASAAAGRTAAAGAAGTAARTARAAAP